MITTRSFADQVWTDLNSPTKEELDSLTLSQHLSPIIAKDLATPTPRQHTEEFDESIYAVVHIPFFKHSQSINSEQEIDFVIKPSELITTRYESIDALHHFAKQIEVNEILNKDKNAHLFIGLMSEIYTFLFDEIEYFKDWIKEAEKNIFKGKEKQMVFSISIASRNILSFKRIVYPHQNVLAHIAEISQGRFGPNFQKDIKNLIEEWERLMQEINNIAAMLDELRDTNDAILSTKQNEVMKQIAVIGSVILPTTIIGQLFGLSITAFPLKENPLAFWIILSIIMLVVLLTSVYAKIKKWM